MAIITRSTFFSKSYQWGVRGVSIPVCWKKLREMFPPLYLPVLLGVDPMYTRMLMVVQQGAFFYFFFTPVNPTNHHSLVRCKWNRVTFGIYIHASNILGGLILVKGGGFKNFFVPALIHEAIFFDLRIQQVLGINCCRGTMGTRIPLMNKIGMPSEVAAP